jgi:putative transcriptional regulator
MMVKENQGVIRNRLKVLIAQKEISDGRNYSYADIQAATGIAVSTLVDWAKGRAKYYAGDTLAALCNFFDCKPGDLLEYLAPSEVTTEENHPIPI